MISKDKIDTRVIIDRKIYEKARKKADTENRSYSNYVANLIEKDLNK